MLYIHILNYQPLHLTESGLEFEMSNECSEPSLEDCFVAERDYTRQAADELDMFEGQIVCMIDDSHEGETGGMDNRNRAWFRPGE